MRFDRSKRGLLAADVARFRDDVFDPHMISFRPRFRGEGDGRPLLCEAEIEPPCMEGTVPGVCASGRQSQVNHGQADDADATAALTL